LPRSLCLLTLAAVLTVLTGPAGHAQGAPPAPRLARAAAPAPAPAPAKDAASHLRAVLTAEMRRAGPQSGALVVDLSSGRELYALRAGVPRAPASVEKLYTTAAALARFGAQATLQTAVTGVGTPDARGVWHGNLYLKGAGDPTFGTRAAAGGQASATNLAAALFAASGISRVDGAVIGDESLFDALRGEPDSGYLYDQELGGRLSGLAFDRGRLGGLASPAAFAASQLAAAIRAAGVPVTGRSDAGLAPPGARVLARVSSPPLAALVAMTDLSSDNFFAEMLLKGLGARFGAAGTTVAGAAVVARWLAGLGIAPHVVDGSGLSRADQTSPRQVVDLLRALRPDGGGPLASVGATLLGALPVAGRSGTLIHRMRGTPAAGRCLAKTGSLIGVSSLAGLCDGRFAFAFLMNAIGVAKARALQDHMTVALAAAG
jgi:D-alanyl-D-alanine carboxypeptidase/D-alanyl-D-alanine-endopeptidase (penicillin-binding protein 4)